MRRSIPLVVMFTSAVFVVCWTRWESIENEWAPARDLLVASTRQVVAIVSLLVAWWKP